MSMEQNNSKCVNELHKIKDLRNPNPSQIKRIYSAPMDFKFGQLDPTSTPTIPLTDHPIDRPSDRPFDRQIRQDMDKATLHC